MELIDFPCQYGTYKMTISSFEELPKIELMYSSNDSEDCIHQAHMLAENSYRKHSEYSLNMGMIPLKAKWIVYNQLSYELEIFYACRKNKEEQSVGYSAEFQENMK